MGFVANFITFLAVKEFWRYVKFWPSYGCRPRPRRVFGTQCKYNGETLLLALNWSFVEINTAIKLINELHLFLSIH